MRVILATNHLGLGGSETYLLTVAEQLDRLGHEPVVYTREPGAGAVLARKRGIPLLDDTQLPTGCDAILAQDAGVSLELASRYSGVPHVFVAHSDVFDLQAPPRLEGVVSAVIALNDRVLNRLRAMALDVDLVRMRQPIDAERFVPQGALPERARRLLLLSNNLLADRMAMLEVASRAAGLELRRTGGSSSDLQATDIRPALAEADIVVGYGRSVLEAMACGRAAYVYDRHGGDGWVTPQNYPDLEADGFGGRGKSVTVDEARLVEDLRSYSPSMGPANHDLVLAPPRANRHAEQLVALLRGYGTVRRESNTPLLELARMVRLEWRARVEAQAMATENARLNAKRHEVELELPRAVQSAIEETTEHYEGTLSWRLTRPLRAVTTWLRAVSRGAR